MNTACLLYTSTYVVILTCSVMAKDTITSDWGPITNNAQMSISLEGTTNVVKLHEPVVLLFHYRNISTNEMFWFSAANGYQRDFEYSFQVIAPSGKDISPNMKTNMTMGGSGQIVAVGPNQIRELKYHLSYLCNFDELGTYTIVAQRSVIWGQGQEWGQGHKFCFLVSNPLSITVVSDKLSPIRQPYISAHK